MLLYQSSEGRDFLLSMGHVAAWVAEKVLPLLAKRADDDGAESDASPSLGRRITEVSLQSRFCHHSVALSLIGLSVCLFYLRDHSKMYEPIFVTRGGQVGRDSGRDMLHFWYRSA